MIRLAWTALCAVASAAPRPQAMQRIISAFHAGADRGAPVARPVTIPGPHTAEIVARDGTKLHTIWTLPGSGQERYSTAIDRSPYGDTGTELVADVFVPLGFAAVGQDFRGTYQSGGNFDLWKKSYNDTADTVGWVLKQQWSNGDVHLVGGSADGIAVLVMAAQPALPAVKSQFIIWATAAPYSSVYPGGAYRYGLIHNWLHHYIKHTNATALEQEVFKHESPVDPWWADVTPDPDFSQVRAPTVFWAGWYDIFLNGNLVAYHGWQKATKGNSWLVVDPLGHCQGAADEFPGAGVEGRVALAALLGASLFDGKLNRPGEEVPENVKKVTWFVMGANRSSSHGNFWTTADAFPEPDPKSLFLHHDGSLAPEVPLVPDSRRFTYDPTHPAPTIGGNNLELPCGPKDQRPKENRSDVLVHTTAPLTEPLAVVGHVSVTLYVSSANVNDTDWTAQLSDVYPDGTSRLIQDGIIRMRWRNAGLHPEPIVPGRVYAIEVDLWSTAYVFDPGHAIRVVVSSSNAPRFTPNPNTGLALSDPRNANAAPVAARQTLHMSALRPSRLTLPVVPLDSLPRHIVV